MLSLNAIIWQIFWQQQELHVIENNKDTMLKERVSNIKIHCADATTHLY